MYSHEHTVLSRVRRPEIPEGEHEMVYTKHRRIAGGFEPRTSQRQRGASGDQLGDYANRGLSREIEQVHGRLGVPAPLEDSALSGP